MTTPGAEPSTGPSFTLDEALRIVRGAVLSRAAVETSTPEQIVWLTAEAIARGFTDARLDTTPERRLIEAAARRAIERAGLGEKTRDRLLRLLDDELSGWPS